MSVASRLCKDDPLNIFTTNVCVCVHVTVRCSTHKVGKHVVNAVHLCVQTGTEPGHQQNRGCDEPCPWHCFFQSRGA